MTPGAALSHCSPGKEASEKLMVVYYRSWGSCGSEVEGRPLTRMWVVRSPAPPVCPKCSWTRCWTLSSPWQLCRQFMNGVVEKKVCVVWMTMCVLTKCELWICVNGWMWQHFLLQLLTFYMNESCWSVFHLMKSGGEMNEHFLSKQGTPETVLPNVPLSVLVRNGQWLHFLFLSSPTI